MVAIRVVPANLTKASRDRARRLVAPVGARERHSGEPPSPVSSVGIGLGQNSSRNGRPFFLRAAATTQTWCRPVPPCTSSYTGIDSMVSTALATTDTCRMVLKACGYGVILTPFETYEATRPDGPVRALTKKASGCTLSAPTLKHIHQIGTQVGYTSTLCDSRCNSL